MSRDEQRFKKLYLSMLNTGELKEVFSSMTGNWEKDKRRFIKEQTELEELLNIQDFNLEEDEIDDFN